MHGHHDKIHIYILWSCQGHGQARVKSENNAYVQVLDRARTLVKPEDGGGAKGEASRGLVEALASLGQELRDREDLRLEVLRLEVRRGQQGTGFEAPGDPWTVAQE
jgi:hypothetical protein